MAKNAAPRPGEPTATEALRADAVADLDALLHAAATLRAELRVFETVIRRNRRHLARGGDATKMREMFNIAQVREGLTHAATNFQATRHTSRLSVFRLQSAEGMSIGAIARDWGLSRQLVSRMIKEHQTDRAAAT